MPVQKNSGGKWYSRRHRGTVEYSLGSFDTKEEAIEAEYAFDKSWPGKSPRNGRGPLYFKVVELIGKENADKILEAGIVFRQKGKKEGNG